jgi:hypothetical protein
MTATTAKLLSELELLEIGYTADDHAGRYYGGPLGLNADDAARYVTEGHLGHLIARHGFGAVWDAVANHLACNPSVLTLTNTARTEARNGRIASAEQHRKDAKRSFDIGDFDSALALIADAERLDPHFGGYASIRLMISQAANPAAEV